jgi:hypothetical protein
MKRMNEVFELPIKREQSEDGKPVFISILEQAEKAHAAKHIEALADALADLIAEVEFLELNVWPFDDKAALAAYRGKP